MCPSFSVMPRDRGGFVAAKSMGCEVTSNTWTLGLVASVSMRSCLDSATSSSCKIMGMRVTGVQYDKTKHRLSGHGRENLKNPEEKDSGIRVLEAALLEALQVTVVQNEDVFCREKRQFLCKYLCDTSCLNVICIFLPEDRKDKIE